LLAEQARRQSLERDFLALPKKGKGHSSELLRRKQNMHLNLEPIGIIKKAANKSEILIYADFEQIIRNIVNKIGERAEAGQKLLVIHKNNKSKKPKDGHQVQVTKAILLERNGNLLTVSGIDANEDSVIDVRLELSG